MKYTKVDDCRLYSIEHFNIWRKFSHWLSRRILKYIFLAPRYTYTVEGKEYVPRGQSLVIASNHVSLVDPPLMVVCTDLPVAFMAKQELFHTWWKCLYYQSVCCFAVDRDTPDLSTLKTSINALKSPHKWCLGIFPEGTRSEDGTVKPFTNGAVKLAQKGKAPILPMGVRRVDNHFTVRFGPILPSEGNLDEVKEKLYQELCRLSAP